MLRTSSNPDLVLTGLWRKEDRFEADAAGTNMGEGAGFLSWSRQGDAESVRLMRIERWNGVAFSRAMLRKGCIF